MQARGNFLHSPLGALESILEPRDRLRDETRAVVCEEVQRARGQKVVSVADEARPSPAASVDQLLQLPGKELREHLRFIEEYVGVFPWNLPERRRQPF